MARKKTENGMLQLALHIKGDNVTILSTTFLQEYSIRIISQLQAGLKWPKPNDGSEKKEDQKSKQMGMNPPYVYFRSHAMACIAFPLIC
jgi:hypothetical protein